MRRANPNKCKFACARACFLCLVRKHSGGKAICAASRLGNFGKGSRCVLHVPAGPRFPRGAAIWPERGVLVCPHHPPPPHRERGGHLQCWRSCGATMRLHADLGQTELRKRPSLATRTRLVQRVARRREHRKSCARQRAAPPVVAMTARCCGVRRIYGRRGAGILARLWGAGRRLRRR